ncbi:DUF922 domain-containing protein [Roseibium sediminicola]|uniref:DUF922 domain-containing Zn-dependent protease n=1 Tax=Roseibium sediminicola TaxID=2933272 RepID=A0ABT0GS72_9HYPH|nr:DUF922 domain-containing protein [Roseibium sp. CAU 1639]MCK7612289.1 DUF922 domain-containing Zn-dependent protease [Roseibium sp. CAU 1639]
MFSRRMTFLIVMLVPILGSGDHARAEIRSDLKEKSYLVSGTSAMAVAAFMRRRPFRGDYGPAIANIRPRYTHTFKTDQRKDHCRVTDFRLSIDFTMTLPKARNRQAFDRRTLSAWRSLRGFTRRHELVHRKIYLGCAKRMEWAVLKLRPRYCGGIGRQIRMILNEEKKACKERHLAFDRREINRLKYHRFFELARRQRESERARLSRRIPLGQGAARNGRLLFFVAE